MEDSARNFYKTTFEPGEDIKKSCLSDNTSHSSIVEHYNRANGLRCPRIFDGISCWDATPAGATAFQACPRSTIGFDSKQFVFKECTEDGTWYENPLSSNAWANYTSCVDVEESEFRNTLSYIFVVGYFISIVNFLLGITVLLYYHSLHCTRTRIHIHLFASFACCNVVLIIWYTTVANSVTVVLENSIWCQMLHISISYFVVTSYLWMFCEGFYLHLYIVMLFVDDRWAMRLSKIFGWGFSILITIIYASVRYYWLEDTGRCWMEHSNATWILTTPIILAMVVSILILFNIIRILMMKYRPAPNRHGVVGMKKVLRATLILIPLFGSHFLLMPFQPQHNSVWAKPYEIAVAFVKSLQGSCIAIVLCLNNHDVMVAAQMHIARYRRTHAAFPISVIVEPEQIRERRMTTML